jgi:hypothetical protein
VLEIRIEKAIRRQSWRSSEVAAEDRSSITAAISGSGTGTAASSASGGSGQESYSTIPIGIA